MASLTSKNYQSDGLYLTGFTIFLILGFVGALSHVLSTVPEFPYSGIAPVLLVCSFAGLYLAALRFETLRHGYVKSLDVLVMIFGVAKFLIGFILIGLRISFRSSNIPFWLELTLLLFGLVTIIAFLKSQES